MKDIEALYCINTISLLKDLTIERLASQYHARCAKMVFNDYYHEAELVYGKATDCKDAIGFIEKYYLKTKHAADKAEYHYIQKFNG